MLNTYSEDDLKGAIINLGEKMDLSEDDSMNSSNSHSSNLQQVEKNGDKVTLSVEDYKLMQRQLQELEQFKQTAQKTAEIDVDALTQSLQEKMIQMQSQNVSKVDFMDG